MIRNELMNKLMNKLINCIIILLLDYVYGTKIILVTSIVVLIQQW